MVIFGAGIDLGLVLLLSAVLVKYGGIKLASKQLNLLATGAVFFILAGVLSGVNLGFTIPPAVDMILNIIGAIAVVIGVLWSAYSLVMSKK